MKWLWGRGKAAQEMHACLQYRNARLEVEELESREVLSPLTPIQARHAYGFDKVNFSINGQVIKGDGAGQTIAIVVAYDNAKILQDADAFSKTFTLGNGKTLYQEYGAATKWLTVATPQGKPAADTKGLWALEASLDVQWAHAVAPGAKILLVQAKSNAFMDLMNAADYARQQPGVTVVSMSWGAQEFSTETKYDSYFTTPAGHTGVTFVAASGDYGTPGLWPGVSTNVISVGGTTLKVDAYGNYLSEVGWKGSGGGVSLYEPKPGYQQNVAFSSTKRAGPDVAYNGDPATGFYVYHSLAVNGVVGTWWSVGGTSIGAPQWAGLIAIANQGRALAGLGSLDGASQTLPALYKMASSNFHDVVSGSNGKSAGIGFDLVTGRGSPYADRIIRDLVAYNVKSGVFTATSVKVVGPGPTFTPASMFMTLVEGPNGDVAENPQATVDWSSSLLRRTEFALAEYAPVNRLRKLVHWFEDQGTDDRDGVSAFWSARSWHHADVDGCFTSDEWSLLWDHLAEKVRS